MADQGKKIDPFDVEALEKSLNDSATRVSTIWVSFLIFSLYLLTAATTVTHRQILLADPIKLPVLNIDLPLWGFSWLAPVLFVILHAYVLIQVVLLSRTAAAYNVAIEKVAQRNDLTPTENSSLRQRLANTLFAQIFAGSPRERSGPFGALLNVMAWITLAIAPILILLTFQFMFLPYHSHFATWTHRLLILLEFTVAFQLWPLVLNAERDFRWPNFRWRTGETAAHFIGLFRPAQRTQAWQGLRPQVIPLAATVLFVVLSLWLASFPGEPHVNLATGRSLDAVVCRRWVHQNFARADMRFDRLVLPRVDIIDHDKLEKIEKTTKDAEEKPHQGERTRILHERDLNCGDFSDFADLRRVDLRDARLVAANFNSSKLQGASLAGAQLRGAHLEGAELQGASLSRAQLQSAWLLSVRLENADLRGTDLQDAVLALAQLQGASLDDANLQGARLEGAELQGASLSRAQLQGASLDDANLQGAYLGNAELPGASLERARLQGAFFPRARLQGASLNEAKLEGASLALASLQGADFDKGKMDHADFSYAYVWRAKVEAEPCRQSRVEGYKSDPNITNSNAPSAATPDNVSAFIERSVSGIPDESRREGARARMRARLLTHPNNDDSVVLLDVWSACEREPAEPSEAEFDRKRSEFIVKLVCSATRGRGAMAERIVRNWYMHWPPHGRDRYALLARGLLGQNGQGCAATNDLTDDAKVRLRAVIAEAEAATSASGAPVAPAQ